MAQISMAMTTQSNKSAPREDQRTPRQRLPIVGVALDAKPIDIRRPRTDRPAQHIDLRIRLDELVAIGLGSG